MATQPNPPLATIPQGQAPGMFDEVGAPIIGMRELLEVIDNEDTKRMLIQQEIERREFVADWKLAKVFALAGYFTNSTGPKDMTPEQAMAKMQIGRAWGVGQAESIRHIYIVNGKPAVENELVAQKLQAAGWNWKPVFLGEGHSCKGCTLWIERDGRPYLQIKRDANGNPVLDAKGSVATEQVSVSFTEKMAQDAKLLEKWRTQGWPQNHYYWKAIAQFKRFHAPGIMTGSYMQSEIHEIIEAGDIPERRRPEIATIRTDSFAPSVDENRGHDQTMPDALAILNDVQKKTLTNTAAQKGLGDLLPAILLHFGFTSVDAVTVDKLDAILAELKKSDAE